jgi:hypothetical protein
MKKTGFDNTIRLWLGLGAVAGLVAIGLWLRLRPAAPDDKPPTLALDEYGLAIVQPLPDQASAQSLFPDAAGDPSESDRPDASFPGALPPDAARVTPPASASPERGQASGPAPAEWTASMQAELDRLELPTVPIKDRLKALEDLGRLGDARSVAILKALGDRNTYLDYAAVEALGRVRTGTGADYLADKLDHADSRVICAAVRSLAAVQGEAALPRIVAALQAHRTRADGHQDVVRTACVEALGSLGVSAGVPPLKNELDLAVSDLGYEYAASVVAALRQIADPAAIPVLRAYIVRLEKDYAAMTDNPMGQDYLREKIRETEAALRALESGAAE